MTQTMVLVPLEPTAKMLEAAERIDKELRDQGFSGAEIPVLWDVMIRAWYAEVLEIRRDPGLDLEYDESMNPLMQG